MFLLKMQVKRIFLLNLLKENRIYLELLFIKGKKTNTIDILNIAYCDFLSYVMLNQQGRHLLSHYSNVSGLSS